MKKQQNETVENSFEIQPRDELSFKGFSQKNKIKQTERHRSVLQPWSSPHARAAARALCGGRMGALVLQPRAASVRSAAHAQYASRKPALPGPGMSGPGFRDCRDGRERLGDRLNLVLRPAPSPVPPRLRPHCKMRANQHPGACPPKTRPPSGLRESYIKKFTSERRERRGRRGRAE